MRDGESVVRTHSSVRRKSSFSLATLLVVLTLCAILLGWLVDHRRLVEQIGPPPQRTTKVYRLSHASVDLVAKELSKLFDANTIRSEPISNSIFIAAEEVDSARIEMILRLVDRKGTDFVETKKVAQSKGDLPPTNSR